eukprot:CAMPEP_0185036716 /NCGR_PEP_ID=MMETSP1103-20130426/30072_1 /TAXON_ID=36769 /ORGANISM="Paraphysomonas bandaiensis, Strain Caron Lab Isolate" /LENGTH=1063 /DNA_ID=CAMNT_0027574349 /DNA_START=301 /DNA_END=3492 /DNA_ORIENTATION=-
MTIVDVLTIFPVYVSLATGSDVNLSIFRFIRILRLVRVLRTFRLLGGLSGLKRQLITLSLTLISLVFMAAGVVNVLENDVQQLYYDCQYINEDTNYRPSCDEYADTYDLASCDCQEKNCVAVYNRYDERFEPTRIQCTSLPFFNCIYFIVVTISTVGYGDISPTSSHSRAVVLLFILTSAVVIPMQLKQLTHLLSSNSIFRSSYDTQNSEEHVVLCGYVNNRSKLEKFFLEFFHPDRKMPSSPHFHVVILCPEEPNEEVRTLLVSHKFDSRATYLIGSALSVEDLQRARVDVASAVFFLCNIEAKEEEALCDGTTIVLRTLAVSDYNPDIQLLVEVVHSKDSDILKNNDVDVVLCVDEFKTVMLAMNAVCPGLSTLISNLFRTYGRKHNPNASNQHWLSEYNYGQCMDVYYIPLPELFLEAFNFDWGMVAESLYVEYHCILLGVFSSIDGDVSLNPIHVDLKNPKKNGIFYGILVGPSQDVATRISSAVYEYSSIARMVNSVLEAESYFGVRVVPKQRGVIQRSQSSHKYFSKKSVPDDKPVLQDIMLFNKLQRLARQTSKSHHAKRSEGVSGDLQSKERKVKINDMKSVVCYDGANTRESPSEKLSVNYNESGRVNHALHMSDHIIVFGCRDNLSSFVEYADLPVAREMNRFNRSILYVGTELPSKWNALRKKHESLYFLEGDICLKSTLSRTNVMRAHSVVMLTQRREELEFEESENLDFEMLFLYLKISSCIPSHVHFTVELTSGQNMSVLNTVALKKERRDDTSTRCRDSTGNFDGGDTISFEEKIMFENMLNDCTDRDTLLKQLRNMYNSNRSRNDPHVKRGHFFSQYLRNLVATTTSQSSSSELLKAMPGRRLSSVQFRGSIKTEPRIFGAAEWDGQENYPNFAIYAAGRTFVPDVVDNILTQSFFSSLTSNICEALVCGQEGQGMFIISLPKTFTYRYFSDVYRACIARYVLVLGLYRAASVSEQSYMPFVYTCPPPRTVLNMNDKLYVYGTPQDVKNCERVLSLPFGKVGNMVTLGSDESIMKRRRSVATPSFVKAKGGRRPSDDSATQGDRNEL